MTHIKVYPGAKNPTHEISLSDGVQTWGLRLDGGPSAIEEVPITPSTRQFTGGGSKFGDWEPGMSHIEQRTWEGGRGQADFVDDATRYFDAKMAWTLTPGKVFPVPNWKFSDPQDFYSEGYQNLPGDMAWRSLGGDYRNIAEPITHSNNWATYDSAWIWVRRVGTPIAGLAVQLWENYGGYPNPLAVHAIGSISIDDVPENESILIKVDLSGGSALVGTESFLVLFGQLNDNAANHWEIGIDPSGTSALYGNGEMWTGSGEFSIYHRITTSSTDRKFHIFEYKGALYAVYEKADGTSSKLFLNGGRGVATGGTAEYIQDSNKAWEVDEWIGAYVKIISGTGAGQKRLVDDNSTVRLYIAPDWDITPDTTSEYVIYHTDKWQDISPSSGDLIDGAVKDVCVIDDYVAFSQGQSVYILKMRWNAGATPPSHEFDDDGTNKADQLFLLDDTNNGPQVYRINAAVATMKRAAPTAWGTNMLFDYSFDVGDSNLPILNVYAHDGKLYAFKADGRYLIEPVKTSHASGVATAGASNTLTDSDQSWTANAYKGMFVRIVSGTGFGQERQISSNTTTALTVSVNWTTNPSTSSKYEIYANDYRVTKTLGEIGFSKSENNGEAVLSYGLYSYFSWGGYALQRLYDSSGDYDLSSIGPDKDEGLPDDRRGRIVDLLGIPPGIMAAVQGDGYSSVLVLPNNSYGWHEVFRGWASGAKIDHIYFHDSYRPRLWISIGGELVYQDWPLGSFNPLKDSGMTYYHEAILVSSTIDMGASSLPKLIESISATVENLASGIEVAMDYQVNDDVGTDNWINAGVFQINPRDTLDIDQGEVYQIRFRLRLRTQNEHIPPIVHATVLEGFARTPVKYQWNLKLQASDTLLSKSGVGAEPSPDAFLTWLKQAAISSRRITMRAIWEQMDNRDVIVEPPRLSRQFTSDITGFWGGQIEVSLREI
ncbi:hypothetical protein KQH61_03925 [bacterium]|nr:hypothetical protein [bacterium]MCB2179051.1 hypothetical protein [bacterium]